MNPRANHSLRIADQRWLQDSGAGDDLDRTQYTYDNAGNMLACTNVVGGWDQGEAYYYDELYRLYALETGDLSEVFTYDPTGNWTNYRKSQTGFPYVDQNRTSTVVNEIATVDWSSTVVTQDAAGNITTALNPLSPNPATSNHPPKKQFPISNAAIPLL